MSFNDEEEIHFCTNCDSEFNVIKIDDDEIEVQYCPFCGADMALEEDDIEDDEYDDYQ